MRIDSATSLAILLACCGSSQTVEPVAGDPPPVDAPVAEAPPPEAPPPEAPPVVAPPTTSPARDVTPAGSFVEATNAFALDLWQKVKASAGNVAYSPASVWVALAMTHEGARGETAAEMARVMRMPADVDAVRADAARSLGAWNAAGRGALTLKVANRLFGEKAFRFERPFLDATRSRWRAPLEGLDFRGDPEGARGRVNAWVARETRDRIRDLCPPGSVTTDTRLVLTNAVYFLGKWDRGFPRAGTRDEAFFTAPGRSVQVATMHQSPALFRYAEIDDVQLVDLPYRGGSFAMTILLPRRVDGLPALETRLDGATVGRYVAAMTEQMVRVSLPKVTIDPAQSLALGRMLQELGMRRAFDAAQADFTGIANPPSPEDRLSIAEVFHKAFVKIDEEGTEAAAATAVMMVRGTSAAPPPAELRADHPFLFLLRDTASGAILFMGRIDDPRS